MSTHERGDVTTHRSSLNGSIGARLATWVSNDMRSLADLISSCDVATIAQDHVFTSSQVLLEALEAAVRAAEHHRATQLPTTPEKPT